MAADSFDSDWPSQIGSLHADSEIIVELLRNGDLAGAMTAAKGMRDALAEMVNSIPDEDD